MEKEMILSTLPKTWFFDLDGTIVKHNGYKLDGQDTLLPGASDYLSRLPAEDKIIIVTSRTEKYREQTLCFLKKHKIRYDAILFGLPMGERIIVNDRKPSGLATAIAVNIDRNKFRLPCIVRES